MFSPKRLSASLDDMRRKAIAKRISRDLSRGQESHQLATVGLNSTITKLEPLGTQHSPTQHKEEYILIPEQDMSFATEKQCKELDIYNESLYKKSNKLYQEITTKLAGSNLELKHTPLPPPNPNNLNRLYHYRQRNRETNCLRQTLAVCYLLKHGYQLTSHNQYSAGEHKLFEPYQAIELAIGLAAQLHENYMNIGYQLFDKLGLQDCSYTETRASTTPTAPPPAFNQDYTRLYPELYTSDLAQLQPTSVHNFHQDEPDMMLSAPLSYYPLPDRRATAPAKLLPIIQPLIDYRQHQQQQPQHQHQLNSQTYNGIECQNPEHHTVLEKINYFDEPTS